MPIRKPSAISGVSPEREAIIMIVYPSIACTWLGRALGRLYDSIPTKLFGVKLSHLLFVLPTAPFALIPYFALKLSGQVYVLTNRGVQKRASLGNRLLSQIPLTNIEDVVVDQKPGQAFYPAADLHLVDKKGDTLMVLEGVPRADVFRQTILEARDACRQVAASLAQIRSRQPAAVG